jgi:hypothetical protein
VNEFLSQLGQRAPQIALAMLAAKQGGPEALAAFQGGMLQRQQEEEARQRQAQMDEERRAQQQAITDRSLRDDQRADDAAKMQRLQAALGYLDSFGRQQADTATDPVVAENAMLGRATSLESMFGVPQGQLAGAVPNLTPAISARKKKLAQELYERAEKTYGPEAMATDNITLTTEAFGHVKPSQLRALFVAPAISQDGAPVAPMVGKPDVPNTPEEKLADAIRRGDTKEIAVLTQAAEAISGARRDPQMTDINRQLGQMRLDAAQTAKATAGLPVATQRRVDIKARAFDSQPIVKKIQTMAEAVTFADGLDPKTTNPADDQALIYSFAKAMDPESVVREGEYATVQKYAQSWAERFGFDVARIFSNTTFLTPEARANMKATIRARYQAARPQYDNVRQSYVTQINRITKQADGNDYLVDYGAAFPEAGSATPADRQPVPNPFRKQ